MLTENAINSSEITTENLTENTKTAFADLIDDKELIAALNRQSIVTPTDVQAAAIGPAMEGLDLVVQAKTGSGKTLAFALPIISQIRADKQARGTVALIITPTRELAVQVKQVICSIAPDITPACIIGGESSKRQVRQLREDSRIVVGTPGRLRDLMNQRLVNLRKCRTFVLDEADEMLSMGFLEEVRAILSRVPRERQGLFFSATITPRVMGLINTFLKNPRTIVIEDNKEDPAKIDHFYCRVSGGVVGKVNALCNLFKNEHVKSAMVFCNTKSDTELVEVYLRRRGFNARRINSDLTQRERDRVLESLKTGELQFLIATDVAARGIDIKEMPLVVNYSLHEQPEVYVHRTGRTGRAGASGRAISLIGPEDFAAFHALKRKFSSLLVEIQVPKSEN